MTIKTGTQGKVFFRTFKKNQPASIVKQISDAINKRISDLSSIIIRVFTMKIYIIAVIKMD